MQTTLPRHDHPRHKNQTLINTRNGPKGVGAATH
jgi:hypothetical protein